MTALGVRMLHTSSQRQQQQQPTSSTPCEPTDAQDDSGEQQCDAGPEALRVDSERFSHLDNTGRARMVNVGAKPRVRRVALARGEICIGTSVLAKLLDGSLGSAKGDMLTVAKLAAIMAAKSTCHLIPMCHQIPLDHIRVEIEPRPADGSLVVSAKVEAEHKTGVELECLTAVSVGLLTIYDMCKSISRNMVISNVRLVYKSKQAELP